MDKILKPKTCEECPVGETKKDKIVCGVARDKKADKLNYKEKRDMWLNCPLTWDKE